MLGDLLMGHAYRVGAGTFRSGNQPNDLILVQRQQDRLDISPPLGAEGIDLWRATNPTAPWRSWHGGFHPFVSGIYRLYKVIRELSIRSERFNTLEFEGHSSVGVNGHCVDNGQPEFFLKLVDAVQLLHLEHESSDGFCLGFPCSFVVRSCSSRALAFSYRSTNPLYRAAYYSWFCAVCEFSAMPEDSGNINTKGYLLAIKKQCGYFSITVMDTDPLLALKSMRTSLLW